jgi:uncharacterized protein YndB with AHSA1/START domain
MSSIKVEKFIQAPPSEVYRYFTNSTAYRDWMCDIATLQPHVGSHIFLGWLGEYYSSGEFLQLEKDKFVSFSWFGRNEPHQTQVDISLKKKKGGTLVKLAHRGLGKGNKWVEIGEAYEKEWGSSLENLASVLETGADLRITRRPMLGVFIGEFNREIATQLCVPVTVGVRLEGVVDGMGAQKAGLQKDDVVVSVDGKDLPEGVPLGTAITGKHAGEVVEIGYYRGPDKKSVKMTLSGRQLPPMPASGMELSKQVEPTYRQYEAEFETLLDGASEEECAYKPGSGEWSVNEILAHLIHSEIGWQNYATEIIQGHEATYDDYGGNLQARIDGTTTAFPTKGALLGELKSHDAETVAMLSHLPEDFPQHKGRLWKLAFNANENSLHLKGHLEQMRAAIEAAREKPSHQE